MIEAGTKFGRYEIRSPIGAGGMGEVYRAEDSSLERRVALKILPAELAANGDRMRRFAQEAKAAATLNHPNIAHVYEIGEENGTSFIAMEFVDGQTLNQFIRDARPDLGAVLRILQHVAEALAKAHSSGVVHRDLKPDNIMVTRDGHAKILDFGLAKLVQPLNKIGDDAVSNAATAILPQQSTPGLILGTAGYMSPEQAQGKTSEIDQRTDVFSFGCILYECVTGQQAFKGSDAIDTLNKIIREVPAPATDFNLNIPPDLQKVIRRCLAKNPDERFQSIKDVAIELKEIRRELGHEFDTSAPPIGSGSNSAAFRTSPMSGGSSTAGEPFDTRPTTVSSAEYIVSGIAKHKTAAVSVLLLLVVASVGVWFFIHRQLSGAQIESIAVMPFVNETGNADLEYLSDGMTESLINSLSQLPKLSVKARSSVFRYKGKDVTPQQVAADLKVQAVLNGRVLQRGDTLTISLELADATTDNLIWGEQYTQKVGDLAALQTEISRDVSQKLRTRLTGAEENRLVRNQTQNTEAYQLYLQGRYYWNKRTSPATNKAIDFFQQAIEKDPNYAMAYVGLAESYVVADLPIEIAESRSRAAALKALELDPTLGEPHASLGNYKNVYEHDYAGAEQEFKRAIELSPNYATAYHWYGEFLVGQGRFDEGFAQYKKALELDPFSLAIGTDYGLGLAVARKYDEAIDYLNKISQTDPSYVRTHEYLAEVYIMSGRYEDAVQEMERKVTLSGADPASVAKSKQELLDALRASGPKGYWTKILEFIQEDMKKGNQIPHVPLAGVHTQLDDRDKAFEHLNKAIDHRDGGLQDIKVSPRWDKLRDDPRFAAVLRRLNLTP